MSFESNIAVNRANLAGRLWVEYDEEADAIQDEMKRLDDYGKRLK